MVGNWLYGVAYRTALHAREAAAKRRAKEAKVVPRIEIADDTVSDLRFLLDQELQRLPQKYRAVVVGFEPDPPAARLGPIGGYPGSLPLVTRWVLGRRSHSGSLGAGCKRVAGSETKSPQGGHGARLVSQPVSAGFCSLGGGVRRELGHV
jgi:hypothetical protein